MRSPSLSTRHPQPSPQNSANAMQTIIDPEVSTSQIPKSSNGSQGAKSRRVRTGCLTCRERHLKCDETLPKCQNCSKSGRVCKRGIRLNFIDTQTTAPPCILALPPGVRVSFRDESREIASEYVGGFEKYSSSDHSTAQASNELPSQLDFTNTLDTSVINRSSFPESSSLLAPFLEASHTEISEALLSESQYTTNHSFHGQDNFLTKMPMNSAHNDPCIRNPEEVLLMQVFVEEVAIWMDSMDVNKHFTQLVPLHALNEPLLLNSLMACGARHLYLVNSSFSEERAIHYYNTASQNLLSHLQNPHRDLALCATAAVMLNICDIMCENPMQRTNHIAGARALIKECRWNGKSSGIGGACFWINVGMELLSCLHFDWQMAWDPDEWHMDIEAELTPSETFFGDEEVWTHRIVYICAKIANFRARMLQFQASGQHAHQPMLQQRCHEWETYKKWCDTWERHIPRSMKPLCYVQPWQTMSKSAFPEVWLIKRSAIVGRLFYHTAYLLLTQTHPFESESSPNMRDMQYKHAYETCGIVAHVKDRGVATASIRCLAIAAECLESREAQEEVIEIFDKIVKETGWRVSYLKDELRAKWGWDTDGSSNRQQSEIRVSSIPPTITTTTSTTPPTTVDAVPSASSTSSTPAPGIPSNQNFGFPSGIVNPLLATADFSMANHPYQDYYVAPQSDLEDFRYPQY